MRELRNIKSLVYIFFAAGCFTAFVNAEEVSRSANYKLTAESVPQKSR